MDPDNPVMSGVVQNQDSYMKGKIAQRWYYDRVAPALARGVRLFFEKTGRKYDFVGAYRCEDAEYILVGMGSYMETAQVTVDYLREEQGHQGRVRRPSTASGRFPCTRSSTPRRTVKAITVFERMDDPLSTTGNHLTREIKAAFCDAMNGQMGHDADRPHAEDLLMLRPGWAAATCGLATSLPPLTT